MEDAPLSRHDSESHFNSDTQLRGKEVEIIVVLSQCKIAAENRNQLLGRLVGAVGNNDVPLVQPIYFQVQSAFSNPLTVFRHSWSTNTQEGEPAVGVTGRLYIDAIPLVMVRKKERTLFAWLFGGVAIAKR